MNRWLDRIGLLLVFINSDREATSFEAGVVGFGGALLAGLGKSFVLLYTFARVCSTPFSSLKVEGGSAGQGEGGLSRAGETEPGHGRWPHWRRWRARRN